MPPGAIVDGVLLRQGQQNPTVASEMARIASERASQPTGAEGPPPAYALEPLDPPIYLVVKDGEQASISGSTGEFKIGEEHQDTFQFLTDQLGADKMRVIFTEVYESRWGPYRPAAGDTTERVPPKPTIWPDSPQGGEQQ